MLIRIHCKQPVSTTMRYAASEVRTMQLEQVKRELFEEQDHTDSEMYDRLKDMGYNPYRRSDVKEGYTTILLLERLS